MIRDTTRICKICAVEFTVVSHNKLCCSIDCSVENRRLSRNKAGKKHWAANKQRVMSKRSASMTPERKARIKEYNNNYRYKSWATYISDLVKMDRRRLLNRYELLDLLEKQKYRCAISGIPLTHTRNSLYNVSIDRIQAGGEYNINNIQLVCRCLNNWRSNTPIKEFIDICGKVAEYNADRY